MNAPPCGRDVLDLDAKRQLPSIAHTQPHPTSHATFNWVCPDYRPLSHLSTIPPLRTSGMQELSLILAVQRQQTGSTCCTEPDIAPHKARRHSKRALSSALGTVSVHSHLHASDAATSRDFLALSGGGAHSLWWRTHVGEGMRTPGGAATDDICARNAAARARTSV